MYKVLSEFFPKCHSYIFIAIYHCKNLLLTSLLMHSVDVTCICSSFYCISGLLLAGSKSKDWTVQHPFVT